MVWLCSSAPPGASDVFDITPHTTYCFLLLHAGASLTPCLLISHSAFPPSDPPSSSQCGLLSSVLLFHTVLVWTRSLPSALVVCQKCPSFQFSYSTLLLLSSLWLSVILSHCLARESISRFSLSISTCCSFFLPSAPCLLTSCLSSLIFCW